MAETVSQETISIPDASPVIDSATPEQTQPITENVIRERIRNNEIESPEELKSLIEKMSSGNTDNVTIEKDVKISEEPQVPKPPDTNNDIPVVSDDFLAEIHKAGFTYRNKNEVIKGLLQKEKAVNTFKEDAIKNREEAKRVKEELEKVLKRQAELESLINAAPKQTAPVVSQPQNAIEFPKPPVLPKYSLDEDEYNRNMDEYSVNLQEYYRKIDAYNEQKLNNTISQVKSEITNKIDSKDKIISKLQQEYEANKIRTEKQNELKKMNEIRDKAFEAAKLFYQKEENKAYKLSKPIEKQYEEYANLNNALNYMAAKDPALSQIAGNDISGNLIREYISGNPYVVQAFGNYDINITDDIKNYQLLVDLESDAYSHNDLDDQGRPDLEMALLRQKKIGGILLQEMQDAKITGFEEAQRIMQMNSSGATHLPASAPSPSTQSTVEMTQEQIIEKLRQIKNLPPEQFKTERDKLLPFLAKLGLIQKE